MRLLLATTAPSLGRAHGAPAERVRDEQEPAEPARVRQLRMAAQRAVAGRTLGGRKGHGTQVCAAPVPRANFPPPYFLSPDAAAAGAGVLAGVLVEDEVLLADDVDELLEDDELLLLDEEESLEEPPSFFVELYRSEYQPPPFRTKLERLTTLDREPSAPHSVQAAGVGSEIFCSTSMVFPQLWQAYS